MKNLSAQIEKRLPELLNIPVVQAAVARELELSIESINSEFAKSNAWGSVKDEINDIVADLIFNESEVVSEHYGAGEDSDEFSTYVRQFGPLFYISSIAGDDIGFFDSLDEAHSAMDDEYSYYFERFFEADETE
jgi:hypothetical protein